MKLRNILFAILVFLLGIKGISAASCSNNDYETLKKDYKDLSALSYYNVIYNTHKSTEENKQIFNADKSMQKLYKCESSTCGSLDNITNMYHTLFYKDDGSGSIRNIANQMFGENANRYSTECLKIMGDGDKTFTALLGKRLTDNPNFDNIDYLWGQVDSAIYRVLNDINTGSDNSIDDIYKGYESYKEEIAVSYEDFCDYLNSHKSISEFIEMALNVVTYAALALGIFLGVLDFIKAIASQEDAALTKAFQSFMKRVAAIALIFLSGVIVTIIINIVPINGVNRDAAICEQFNLSK